MKTHKGKKRGNYKTTGETDTDTDDKSKSGIEEVTSNRSTENSPAIVTKEVVPTDTTKVSTANDTNVGKDIHKETTNKGEENNAENTIVNKEQQQDKKCEFSNSDMDISDESDCSSDSKLIYKSNTKDDEEKERKAKKELDDRKKMYNLDKTIRGWPFIAESLRGRGQRMDRFDRGKEALHRKQKLGYPTKTWYVKQVYLEAAVDHPEWFEDGYTHYNNEKGFHKLYCNEQIDDIIKYVLLIDKRENAYQATQKNMPHPKWDEFRKRIDKAEKNDHGEWRLQDVFVEATKHHYMDSRYFGIPYKNGLGIVKRDN